MNRRARLARISAAIAAIVCLHGTVRADNLTWDSNGTADPLGQDGGGNWDLSSSNWVSGDLVTGTNVLWTNAPVNSATFGNATSAVDNSALPNNIELSDNIAVQDLVLGTATNGAIYNFSDFNGGSLTVNGNITKVTPGGQLQFLLVSNALTFAAGDHTIALKDTPGDVPEMAMNGEMTGPGNLILDNGTFEEYGTLALNVDNPSYAGTITVNKGRLIVTTAGALGSSAAGSGTTIGALGALSVGGAGTTVTSGLNIAEPITISRDTYTGGDFGIYPAAIIINNNGPAQTHTLSGPLVINSNDARISVNSNTLVIPGGTISLGPNGAAGVLSFTGDYAGIVQLQGSNPALATNGIKLVNAVEVQVSSDAALGGPSAPITFGSDATLGIMGGFMTDFGTHVVNYSTFSGGLDIPTGQTFTVSQDLGTSGSGAGTLGKRGGGTLNLSGTNNLTGGQTFFDAGIVNVTGSTTLSSLHLRSPIVNISTGGSITTVGGYDSIGADSTGTNGGPDIAVVNLTGTGQLIETTGDDFNISDNANTKGTINISDNAVFTTGGITFLGKSAGAVGTINQTGGTVNINRNANFGLVIADGRFSDGPQGVYTMSGTSILNCAGEMYVGEGHTAAAHGTGSFTMSGGTVNLSNWFVVGREGGVGTVDISGGTFNHTGGNTSIGDSAGGTDMMTLRGTAQYLSTAGEFWVGTGGGSVGTLIMKDNAVLHVTDWFPVGRAGALGTLDISGNASVTKTGGNNSYVGESTTAVTSTMTVRDSGSFTAASGEFWVGQGGGSGILNIQDNATFTVSNWLALGRSNGASIGVVNLSGGTLTKTSGSGGFLAVGSGGTGTFNQTGGTLNVYGARIGEASSGTANFSGGTATFSGEFSLGYNGGLVGTLNISNTADVTVPDVIVGVNAANASFGGVINLNGGTLTGSSFVGGASAVAKRIFNFNGGTLKPAADSTNFIGAKITSVVSTGGAILDTNGHAVTINSAFTHDAALGGADGGVIKNGAGVVTFAGTNTYTGNTTVNAGTLVVSGKSLGSPVMNATGGNIQLSGNNAVIKTGTINTTAGTVLDVNDGKLIVSGEDVPTVTASVLAGRNGGNWDGTNAIITSQSSAKAAQNITTLAVAAADAANVHKTTFGGVPVTNETLVMYTYNGDANLDGRVDADDYFIIDSNYNKSGSVFGFNNGDFNYDGQINGDDYFAIDSGFAGQGAPIAQGSSLAGSSPAASLDAIGGVQAVPEPASVGMFIIAGAGLIIRRRRRATSMT